jgi:GT2 family glycosyltransferase
MSASPNAAAARDVLRVSVVVPTYRRPEVLMECVASLLEGSRQPDEIVIVGREGDIETAEAIAKLETAQHAGVPIRSAWVSVPGHVPPVETGVRAAMGDLVAVVDDDVTVTPEWLSLMMSPFSDPRIGLVGGRVLIPGAAIPKTKGKPGCVSWYGKTWGNLSSMGGTAVFEVDTVIECNWIWRRSLLVGLEFDPILNFDDASMYGLDLSLQAKTRGFKVVHNPRALVHHHVAPRAPELSRQERGSRIYCYCRNYTYIILRRFPFWRRVVFLLWWFLVGERDAWGLGSLMVDGLPDGKRRHVAQALRGKIEGIRLCLTK